MIGEQLKVFSGNATFELAESVANSLGVELADSRVSQFPDGETSIDIAESVRGCDCFIIQSTCAPVNHNIMELLVLLMLCVVLLLGGLML